MANNIVVKDANGADVTVQSTNNAGVQLPAHQVTDSTGANPLAVSAAGAASTNLATVAGATVPVGSGVMDGGTQRVALATNSPGVVTLESGRVPVNTISGQTGVAGGSGTTGATTQRVVLATDVALPTGTNSIGSVTGPTASGSTLTAAPQTVGGRAATANPTAVADTQVVNAMFDQVGKQVCVGAIRTLKGVTQTSVSNTTGETTIIAAVSAVFQDLYGLVLANTGASTTKVTIKDSTSGTTRMIFEVPTLETRGFMVPVDSAIPQAAVNTNWTATCTTATIALEVTALWVSNI